MEILHFTTTLSRSTSGGYYSKRPLQSAYLNGHCIETLQNLKLCFPKWLGIMSIAIMYNYIVIVGRSVFWDLQNLCPIAWLTLDYISDFLYVLDMFVHAHEGRLKIAVFISIRFLKF